MTHLLSCIESRGARTPVADTSFTLAREGEVWSITCAEGSVRLKHSRALEMLDEVVRQPGRELHVLELGGEQVDTGDAGEVFDETAKQAYRRRVAELEEELEEASAWVDLGRRDRLVAELDLIKEELARGLGLGGRHRRTGAAVERARVNVQKRLRGVIKKIAASFPGLASHLETHVKTGTYVSYRPPASRP
jgi:hypothetical protein